MHPVTDMYLEDVLQLIGYQDKLLGRASINGRHAATGHAAGASAAAPPLPRAGAGKARRQLAQQQQAAAALPKERREAVEAAIMQAFLSGGDEDFDRLLEVGAAPLHPPIVEGVCCPTSVWLLCSPDQGHGLPPVIEHCSALYWMFWQNIT